LLEHLISSFKADHPEIGVRTIVVGSGEALALGRRGDVDVLLVHAPDAERRFVEDGYATDRTPVMYNDFLIVGPSGDPDQIASSESPSQAFARIAAAEGPFVSRGDNSGTHARELAIWSEAGIEPDGRWYLETGQGQGESLQIASERAAYTLTDRATYVALRDVIDLVPVLEGQGSLLNLYSVIVPAAARQLQAAETFADWLTSERGRRVIADFQLGPEREPLFHPLVLGERLPLPGRSELEADPDTAPHSLRGPDS